MSLLTMIIKMSEGLGKTCAIFFLTLLFSLPLGMLVALLRMSKNKVISAVTRFFITVLRGTPLMLQLLAVTYGPYYLFGANVARNKLIPVVIAFAINYAAYFSEIFRGGIQSISRGQYEAGQVLGMSKKQIFSRIVLPQVVKRIVPPMSNEIITLIKDTALARCIMVAEIVQKAYELASTKAIIWPLFFTGVFYLLFNGLLTIIFGKIEKKLSYYHD